jgi:acid phosphatase family membrane protein YuiD
MNSLIGNLIEIDKFGIPVLININGHTEIKSVPGSIISIIFYILLSLYGVK